MSRIFATFKTQIGTSKLPKVGIFSDLTNELGEKMDGEVMIDNQMVLLCMDLKKGNRYLIKFKEIKNNILNDVSETRKLRKLIRCDIFRHFKDEIHFIGGKYQGKKNSDLNEAALSWYCIWLARSSYNEITIKNALTILKKLHDEHIFCDFSNLDLEYEFKRGHQTAIDMIINKNNKNTLTI